METRQKWITAVALSGAAFEASATGFRLPDQDAFATARGEAFAATADNPSAVYYNPAGITQLHGTQVLLGAYGVTFNSRADLKAPGDTFDNRYEPQGAPQFFATWQLPKGPITLGLGVYAPFGFSLKYAD